MEGLRQLERVRDYLDLNRWPEGHGCFARVDALEIIDGLIAEHNNKFRDTRTDTQKIAEAVFGRYAHHLRQNLS